MTITTRRPRGKSKSRNRYQVKLRGDDGRWVTKTFDTKTEAKIYEVKLKSKKFDGEPVNNRANKMLVHDFWELWCKMASVNASQGWFIKQRQMYRDYIRPHIGHIKLLEVLPANIAIIIVKMKEKDRAAQTIVHVYHLLNKMFNASVEDFSYRTRSPVLKKFRPKVYQKESEHLVYREVKILLEYTKHRLYGLAIWIQVYCGLRVSEIIYLEWDKHIDFSNRKLRVRGTWRRSENRFVDYPKGKKWFKVAIPPELLLMFKEAKMRSKSKYVVPSAKDDTVPMSYHWYYKILKQYCRECEVNSKIGTHGLRHSTSGVYMEHGATEEDMQSLFAHSSKETTSRYIHGKYCKKSKVEKVAELIELFPKAINN